MRIVFRKRTSGWHRKHLPESLRLYVVQSLEGRRIAEDIRYGLSEFFDGNGESIGLVRTFHMHERITLLVRNKVRLPESVDSLCYVAEILDIWLNPPIPVVLL